MCFCLYADADILVQPPSRAGGLGFGFGLEAGSRPGQGFNGILRSEGIGYVIPSTRDVRGIEGVCAQEIDPRLYPTEAR